MEKNASAPEKKESDSKLKQKTILVRKFKNIRHEIQNITKAFPKDGNIVANGYVLSRKTIQPNGKMTFIPIGRVVKDKPKAEGTKDDSGD